MQDTSAFIPLDGIGDAADLNSLASIAPLGVDAPLVSTSENRPKRTPGEVSPKVDECDKYRNTNAPNCHLGCSTGQLLVSPLGLSGSKLLGSFASPAQTKLDCALSAAGASISPNRPISPSLRHQAELCKNAAEAQHFLPVTCTGKNCRAACSNYCSVEVQSEKNSSWGVIEEQQQRLECLQQAINYCEERSSMGRTLRSREAAVRARLLHERLEQQMHMQRQRQQRNNDLINDAVGFSLEKTVDPHRPAAERLTVCLTALRKHMRRTLSPSTFATVSTTPGLGGTWPLPCVLSSQKKYEEQHAKEHGCDLRSTTTNTARLYTREEKRKGKQPEAKSKGSNCLAAVLYKGPEDASAGRELIQTRATLLLQQEQGDSNSLEQLLSLEGEVRGRIATLGEEGCCVPIGTGDIYGEHSEHKEQRCAHTPIPEETSEAHRKWVLPQSPPQRLIAHSQLCCSSSSITHKEGQSKGTEAVATSKDLVSNEPQKTFGEQQWHDLARQVFLLQQMLLQRDSHGRQISRKKHSCRRHDCTKTSPKACLTATDAVGNCRRVHPEEEQMEKNSPPTRATNSAVSVERDKKNVELDKVTDTQAAATTELRSGVEYTLDKQRQQLDRQKVQKEQRERENSKPSAANNEFCFEVLGSSTLQSFPNLRSHHLSSTANALGSVCNDGSKSSCQGSDAVHQVRSRAGTPVASVNPPLRRDSMVTRAAQISTAAQLFRNAKQTASTTNGKSNASGDFFGTSAFKTTY